MRLSERAGQILTVLSMTAGRGPLARAVADAAELTPADRVVDIGCGPGTAVRHAARLADADFGQVRLHTAKAGHRALVIVSGVKDHEA